MVSKPIESETVSTKITFQPDHAAQLRAHHGTHNVRFWCRGAGARPSGPVSTAGRSPPV
jgi:hypothetical protein